MTNSSLHKKMKGFTLIELIVLILLAAILASIILNFMHPLTKIYSPVENADELMHINEVMAKIVADYEIRISRGDISSVSELNSFASNLGYSGQDMNNSYGEYHVVQNETIIDGTVDPRKLTISWNDKKVSYMFTVRK